MNSDTAATAERVGVAVMDYVAGRPVETGDLVTELTLAAGMILFGFIKSAPLRAMAVGFLRTVAPGLIKTAITNALDDWKRGRQQRLNGSEPTE